MDTTQRTARSLLLKSLNARDEEGVAKALDQGADPNSFCNSTAPVLARAATQGMCRSMALLIDRGALVDARDRYGWTPAMRALGNGKLDALRLLAARGADLSITCNDGVSLALLAAGSLPALRLLAALGAPLSLPGPEGLLPIDYARNQDRPECAAFLEAIQASLNQRQALEQATGQAALLAAPANPLRM